MFAPCNFHINHRDVTGYSCILSHTHAHVCICVCVCSHTGKLHAVTCEYINGEKQFYHRAQKFYEDVTPSEEGMMGDFVELSEVDLEGSRQFLKKFVGVRPTGPLGRWESVGGRRHEFGMSNVPVTIEDDDAVCDSVRVCV